MKQSFLFGDYLPFVSQVLENLQRSLVIQLLINLASIELFSVPETRKQRSQQESGLTGAVHWPACRCQSGVLGEGTGGAGGKGALHRPWWGAGFTDRKRSAEAPSKAGR